MSLIRNQTPENSRFPGLIDVPGRTCPGSDHSAMKGVDTDLLVIPRVQCILSIHYKSAIIPNG